MKYESWRGRRSARAIIISTIFRVFSKEALEEKKRRVADPNTKDKATKARRIEGADCIELLITFLEAFFEKVAEANGSLSADKLRAIKQHVFNKRNKMSQKEENQTFCKEY